MSLLRDLLEQAAKKPKAPPKPKARPKKNLWFQHPQHWRDDLAFFRGPGVRLVKDENEVVYATDEEEETLYGVWYPHQKRGITFFKNRHLHTACHPKSSLREAVITDIDQK